MKTSSPVSLRTILADARAAALAKFRAGPSRPRIAVADDRRAGQTPEGKVFARRIKMTTPSVRLFRALRAELDKAGVAYELGGGIIVHIPAA